MDEPPDLYAVPPEEFTALRDAAVRAARTEGDRARAKELAALRRPTVPAHLVNLLVRAEPELVDALLDLGEQLAEAQASGSGEALRALGEQRRALVEAVTARAAGLAGREVTAAVRAEVRATLEAGLADPGAAEAVRSGRLVRALSFAGFGGADLEGAVAPAPVRTSGGRTSARTGGGGAAHRDAGEVRAAERAAQDAAGRLDDAVRACERAQRDADRAEAAARAVQQQVREAEDALEAAQRAHEEAERAAEQAAQEAERRADQVRDAQEQAERARAELDALRRG